MDRAAGDAALSAYASLYTARYSVSCLLKLRHFGSSAASLKSDYIKKHGIPARLFNGVRVSLDGKVASVRKTMALRQDSLQWRM